MHLKTILSLLFFSLILSTQVFSQLQRCHTTEYTEYRKKTDPEYIKLLEQANLIIEQQMKVAKRSGNEIYTIPVVVHVVYNTNDQNISDQQIFSQIDVLNEDFRRLNADAANTPAEFQSVAADAGIEFCLASTDPDGNPTNGITRTQTSVTSFGIQGDPVKQSSTGGKDGWPPTDYLNIWVCNLGFVLGYAEMPTANPTWRDGVVVGYQYFGRDDGGTGIISNTYSEGRTATHEVGHWLGLFHIWGDGPCSVDDNISDTPLQGQPYYGCPSHPQSSCSSNDMFMNYMDYTDDNCMNTFTLGQRSRMRTVLTTLRSSILISEGCDLNVEFDFDVGIDEIISPQSNVTYCASRFYPVFEFTNYGSIVVNDLEIEYQINNEPVKTYQWSGNLNPLQSEIVTLPIEAFQAGTYTLQITLGNPNGFIDENPANNSMSVSFTVSPDGNVAPLPLVEGFEGTQFPPANWSFSDPSATFQWERTDSVGGFGLSGASAKFDSYSGSGQSNPGGRSKSLVAPAISLENTNFPFMHFDVAYARFDESFNESLEVEYSLDCGVSWESVYSEGGSSLATTSDKSDAFYPTSNQWRKETVSLNSLNGINHVIFRFTVHSGWGNNLFLDNININVTPSAVTERDLQMFNVQFYPNPGREEVTIEFSDVYGDEHIRFSIVDITGRTVFKDQLSVYSGMSNQMNLSFLSNGFYYFVFESKDQKLTKKFLKH